jgi:propanol-preferring alcohol dehydrogenase
VRALRLTEWGSDPVLTDVPIPEPGPGQVLVQVGGAGACHSDLHFMRDFDGESVLWQPPFTLGHENAGWVHSLGDGVHGWGVGQPVAVSGPWGCGNCARCRAGIEIYCEDPLGAPAPGGGGGLGLDGGMADYLLVPSADFLVGLPDNLDPVRAAPLTDAALTPYHAIRRSLHKLTPDATALVIGAGGLGHLAVQLLRALTSVRIVVIDPRESARTLATAAGADMVLPPAEENGTAIREFAKGRGVEVALDFVGSTETMALAATSARHLGDVTIVGIAGGTFGFSFGSTPVEASLQFTYWGTRAELVEVLDLASRGHVAPVISTFSLDDAPTAYAQLESGEITGRAVIVPTPSYTP